MCFTLPRCVCVCTSDFCPSTYFVQTKLVCLHKCASIDVYVSANLLLMLGRYSGICVVVQGRIAFLLTKQSTSCPLYKQTGYDDQYGYQTHPTVACLCACVCVSFCLNMCLREWERRDRKKRKKEKSFAAIRNKMQNSVCHNRCKTQVFMGNQIVQRCVNYSVCVCVCLDRTLYCMSQLHVFQLKIMYCYMAENKDDLLWI